MCAVICPDFVGRDMMYKTGCIHQGTWTRPGTMPIFMDEVLKTRIAGFIERIETVNMNETIFQRGALKRRFTFYQNF